MRKVPGVTAIRVSLNEGLMVLDFKPGNTVTLGQLRTILKNSGFVSREARLEAVGNAIADGWESCCRVRHRREALARGARGHSHNV